MKRDRKSAEQQMEATVMARAQAEYAQQAGAAAARKDAKAMQLQSELAMQVKYTQMVKDSQKELDGILSKLNSNFMTA